MVGCSFCRNDEGLFQQLVADGDQGQFWRFTGRAKPVIKLSACLVMFLCRDGAHVQGAAQVTTSHLTDTSFVFNGASAGVLQGASPAGAIS